MDKENLHGKEPLPVSFNNFPENLEQTALFLIEKGKEISFNPLEYQEALTLLPSLKGYSYVYKENLEKFARFVPNLKKKQNPDDFFHREIRDFLVIKIGCLVTSLDITEEQRRIINEGKGEIGNSFEKNSVAWNAIYSFWFNSLHYFFPQEEIFKIKPNPFISLLNFAEKGVIVRTNQPKFLIDIPLKSDKSNNGEDYFYGCWDPFHEDRIIQGHSARRQNCSYRQPLENG